MNTLYVVKCKFNKNETMLTNYCNFVNFEICLSRKQHEIKYLIRPYSHFSPQ